MLSVVLQTQRLRESDLLLHLLTEEWGRILCTAKGVLKSKQRFPGGIDLWDSGYFEIAPPRARGFALLESISQRERWPRLREDLVRYTFASFASELVLRLTEEDHAEDGALVRPLLKTLHYLSTLATPAEQAALCAYFAAEALRMLGYDLSENTEQLQSRPDVEEWLRAMLEQGAPIVPNDLELLTGGFALLCFAVEGILGKELRSKQPTQDTVFRLARRRHETSSQER